MIGSFLKWHLTNQQHIALQWKKMFIRNTNSLHPSTPTYHNATLSGFKTQMFWILSPTWILAQKWCNVQKIFGETRSNTFHPLQIRKTNINKFFPSIFEAYYSYSSIFTVKKCKITNNYSIADFEDPLESPKLGLPIPRFKM